MISQPIFWLLLYYEKEKKILLKCITQDLQFLEPKFIWFCICFLGDFGGVWKENKKEKKDKR